MTQIQTKVQKVIERLEALPADQLIHYAPVRGKFIQMYNLTHGSQRGELIYEAEKFHFLKLLETNAALKDCTKMSLYGCMIDSALDGLSFNPDMKHQYLVPFGGKAQRIIDGRGELALRIKYGQVKYVDQPVMVYDWDLPDFVHGTRNGQYFVDHVSKPQRPASAKIIAAYLRITRNDGSIDYKVMSFEDLMRLKSFSKQPNGLMWQEKSLPGTFANKIIKHAFINYPKLKLGSYSQLETEAEEITEDVVNYDLVDEETGEITPVTSSAPAPSAPAANPVIIHQAPPAAAQQEDDSDY
ncbi:RecT Recombinational DNA repair protein (RecE pathway) [uncultured Caudovirales phage]|uniref:RecT Recombinational DNA repair protein (RecE pathway) n=1 Tax=uncultured Caudovirales phage TaxID=2100421 RepID=A0A6J5SSU9_9CAUD|nr:RecT Recombinational DNA repair protein (RecE pathway) [uncultured Caudovirales phage]